MGRAGWWEGVCDGEVRDGVWRGGWWKGRGGGESSGC